MYSDVMFLTLSLFMHISQVDSAWGVGDRESAWYYSRRARLWNILGIVKGVVIYCLVIVIVVTLNAAT